MSKRYSEQEVSTALHRLALEAGNSVTTGSALNIPEQTLRKWRNDTHREAYERIRDELADRLDRELAEDMAGLTRQRIEILKKTGARSLKALEELERLPETPEEAAIMVAYSTAAKDLAGADKSFTTSLGILTQNNRVLRDKPSEITERRADWGLMSAALRQLVGQESAHDTTAEEITDAEVVDPPSLPSAQQG